MKKTLHLILLLLLSAMLTACVDETQYPDDPRGNFTALWKMLDEHYCFFDEKAKTYGTDWQEVKTRYEKQLTADMRESQLFEVMANMLGELHDGHVNIYTPWDVARYWSWYEDYPSNYDNNLIDDYLGTDYRITNGLRYRILDDNIAYLQCPTFQNDFGSGNLDEIFYYFQPCRALIIDIRNNGGGQLTSAEELAARFTNETLLVGYMRHKTGKGHDDFSGMKEQKLKPTSGIRWQKPVAVLTNRSVFSAANEFVKYMKCCPQTVVVGDHTGGGSGMPFTNELPCGWTVRFSACPMYDRDGNSTEEGIEPDHYVALTEADALSHHDTIIEYARTLLTSKDHH